jgi:hypothetical protein
MRGCEEGVLLIQLYAEEDNRKHAFFYSSELPYIA